MKTLNQFLEQGQPAEEPKKEDPKVKQAQAKENMLKKRVLMTKIRAVRGGAEGIMASYEPDGELVEGVMKMIKSVARKKKEKTAEKAMDAGARAKRKLARKVHAKYVSGSEDNVPDDIREAKVDAGKSPEQKEKDRNVRRFGVSHNVAGHGKLRRALHRSDRGDKKRRGDKSAYVEMESKKNPNNLVEPRDGVDSAKEVNRATRKAAFRPFNKEEKEKGLDGKACWKGYRLAGTKKKGGKTVDNCVKEEDKAFNYVVSKLKKKYGDGVLTKGDKIKPQSAAEKAKARAHQAKVDAENAAERAKDPSQGRYPKG
jgi:hypothetical protein